MQKGDKQFRVIIANTSFYLPILPENNYPIWK
uniref:Uncharacterized protein n=1 Tax=Rhizophora mucronata TaxID=61149 RepID=A0A2P2PFX2_RHIMU